MSLFLRVMFWRNVTYEYIVSNSHIVLFFAITKLFSENINLVRNIGFRR